MGIREMARRKEVDIRQLLSRINESLAVIKVRDFLLIKATDRDYPNKWMKVAKNIAKEANYREESLTYPKLNMEEYLGIDIPVQEVTPLEVGSFPAFLG